jgi:hypothetical protein
MDNLTLKLSKKTIQFFAIMIAIGVISLVYGFFGEPSGKRVAANLLLNNYYFSEHGPYWFVFRHGSCHIRVGMAYQCLQDRRGHGSFHSRWQSVAPVVFCLGGLHLVFEWTHEDHLDAILLKKTPYLNQPFFYIRFLVIVVAWSVLAYYIRKTSLKIDVNGEMKYFNRLRTLSAVFIVFYALSSVVSSWDWLMSIDAHWFSTLYGWYVFSSMLASGTALLIIILYILIRMGYMKHVNKEHVHDLGKYLFGFSVFWAYLWFSQYMLIWYANIPEETVYFYERHKNFEGIFYINLILNFVIPFFLLMARKSKRMFPILITVAVIVFIGHWVDLYMMIMPGAVGGEQSGIGLLEIGLTIGYLGLFMLVTFWAMSKTPLVSKKHPFLRKVCITIPIIRRRREPGGCPD